MQSAYDVTLREKTGHETLYTMISTMKNAYTHTHKQLEVAQNISADYPHFFLYILLHLLNFLQLESSFLNQKCYLKQIKNFI